MKFWDDLKKSYFFYSFKRDKVAVVSFFLLVLLIGASVLAPVIAPHNPYDSATIDVMDAKQPPS